VTVRNDKVFNHKEARALSNAACNPANAWIYLVELASLRGDQVYWWNRSCKLTMFGHSIDRTIITYKFDITLIQEIYVGRPFNVFSHFNSDFLSQTFFNIDA
jgi:hypothetical protein